MEVEEHTCDSVCPICFHNNKIFDGPHNSDIETQCIHYFCTDCIRVMEEKNINRCPMCRADWSEWIRTDYSDRSSSCSHEEQDDEDEYRQDDYYYDTDEE